MSRWKSYAAAAATLACAATLWTPGVRAGEGDGELGIVRIDATGGARTVSGTAVLVRRERIDTGVALYFVTAGHLVEQTDREGSAGPLKIRLASAGGMTIATTGRVATFPAGGEAGVDLAVLRIVVADSTLTPVPVSLDGPAVGDAFVIRSANPDARPIAERVLFRSSEFVVGDRQAETTDGLIGAPAIGESGMFGLVTSFGTNRVPTIALLSSTEDLVSSAVPALTPPVAAPLRLEERTIDGPFVTVACGATETGDIDVPVPLAPRESLLGARAELKQSNRLDLGSVTILGLSDRSVKLRFTMIGTPPPAFAPPAPCPAGRALITIGVDVLVVPR